MRSAPRLRDSVCTVTFSGASASTCSSVARKPSGVSPGRPAIRSMFTAKPPVARTRLQRVVNVLRGVAAADRFEHAVVERLGVDADAVDPVRAQHVQLVGRDGVRPAGLDGELAQGAEIERRLELRAQRVELARRERGRRAAADVERHDAQTGALHGLCRRGDLARERLQKLRHERHALFHRLAHKAAVGAARRAKRDAHVQAHVLVAERVHGAQRGVRAVRTTSAARAGATS